MKRWLSNNLLLKAFSLLFAALLWFYLTAEQEAELGFPVRIEFSGLPSSLVVSEGKIDHATVWLRGVRRNLFNLRAKNMVFKVDLKEATEGMLVYPLTEDGLEKIPGIVVEKIVPPVLNLKIEKLIKKRLYVKPKLKGMVPRGYEFVSASVYPRVIQVRGRRSVLQGMKSIYTYPVDISNLTQPANFEVPANLEAYDLELVDDSRMVKVRVNVKEHIVQKRFVGLPLIVKELPQNYNATITPTTTTIEVKGPEILLDNLKPVDIKVFVSAKNLPAGIFYKRRAEVELPEKVSVVKIEPALYKIKKFRRKK